MAFDFALNKYVCDYEIGSPHKGWHSCKRRADWAIKSSFDNGANHYCTEHKLIVERQASVGDSTHLAGRAEWRKLNP